MSGRCLFAVAAICLTGEPAFVWGDETKTAAKPVPAGLARLIQGSTEDFVRHFDKNKDGYLTRDELPPRLARAFNQFDRNGDGKLDRQEVDKMLQVLRQRLGLSNGLPAAGKGGGSPQQMVARMLQRMDTNKDGKISREEARGPLAKNFDLIDTNKDGYLDREELLRAARRFLANNNGLGPAKGENKAQPKSGPAVDFDALDLNADGRLTRSELKGTPYEQDFDAIDTNRDGKIDRKEFQAYLKSQSEKQQKKD
jgi:Ca2+-binding EF-hand superfamily protein